ncbi:MAG: M28 family metallopeptidase [Anaerolineales bacterium]|jgi:hypothetical protein
MRTIRILSMLLVVIVLVACAPVPQMELSFDPSVLRFSGENAYELEEEFVTTFTRRVSGTEQSRLGTEWLRQQLEGYGWNCEFDDWEVINYSKPVQLRNVVCRLPGVDTVDEREILVVAHHDIAPTTIEGADNDGSGVAILLHLAEIFGAEEPPRYTLVFVVDDAEEYGMIGSRRYIQTHPNPGNIIAGLSLDNLGRYYYDKMILESVGQFSGYSPIWISLMIKEAARDVGGLWEVVIKTPVDQALDQAVPISLTDQGPMVAAGVPALGFSAGYPSEIGDEHYRLWHDPDDNMENQSPEAMEQSGLLSEVWIRQLLSMEDFPEESGPYLYFENSESALRGLPLHLIFIVFTGLFFAVSYFSGGRKFEEKINAWKGAVPHFLGLWLPLVASVLLLYLFVEVGILVEYHLYPATTKDPEMLNPDWLAVFLFLIGLALFLAAGRWLVQKFVGEKVSLEWVDYRSFAFLVIGLVGISILIANPFSLLFMVPVLFWLLIRGRKGAGRLLDILFLILGGLMLYMLIYSFGWLILRYGWVFLWMFLNVISSGMFSFQAMLAGTAVLAAGLTLVVNPPGKKMEDLTSGNSKY